MKFSSWSVGSVFLALVSLGAFTASAEKVELRHARNFAIERFDSHSIVRVWDTWVGSGNEIQSYALVPKGDALPVDLPEGSIVVRTPVERMVAMATVFLGPVHDLDLYDSLVGVTLLRFVNDQRVRELADQGKVVEVQGGAALNVERMLLLQPDLILTSTTGNATFDTHPQLLRAGLPVVVTASYMENTPLARTEWIKFVAEFYGMSEEAERIFREIEERYLALAEMARSAKDRPTVFSNAPYGGVWTVPGGKSYTATAFRDAGADFVWRDDDSKGGRPLDFEAIVRDAADADFWLNPSHYSSMRQLMQVDERFARFRAVREGNVFNNVRRVNEYGGNDIYERGVSHPEEVLADLIKIFHPEMVPEHEFVFYQKLH